MASSFTDRLRLEKQGSGENDSTWGTLLNTLFDMLDDAIAGMTTINTTGGTSTLTTANGTSDQARRAMLKVTGVLVSNCTIEIPAKSKVYQVWNATTGSGNVTVKTSGGTGVEVPRGKKHTVFCDGSDCHTIRTSGKVIDRSSNTVLGAANFGDTIRCTASYTQTFDAAATLGDGWWCAFRVETGQTLTLDPNSTEQIDGATTKAIAGVSSGFIFCNGAALYTIGVSALSSSNAAALGASASAGTADTASRSDHVHQRQLECIPIAVGDETTDITTGTAKVTFRMPYGFTLTDVKGSLTTASSSGTVTVDINESGTTVLSTKLTIDANEKTSATAAAAPVISDSALAADSEITIDIDGAGSGAKGLKVYLIGRQS